MRIFHISDIHLEFHIKNAHPKKIDYLVHALLPSKDFFADVLIVAGDIAHYNHFSIPFLRRLKEHFTQILVTYGNHDLYLISDRQQKKYHQDSFRRLEEFKEQCARYGIVFLDNDFFEYQGICFYGLMGWYRVEDYALWKELSNDAKFIKGPFDPNRLFFEAYEKLLCFHRPIDILFSHVPLFDLRDEKSSYDSYYYWLGEYAKKTLSHIKKLGVKGYIFGHTHKSVDLRKDGLTIKSNPIGYHYTNQKIEIF
ncbi:MAG: hypothetical protein C6H99_00640 [Epsilonproteobacteria bacterium]|nr:hypothetical protein [Campylobacterota bacterium]NPA64905.1 hypothetical protein [Campylobacterota bacterium]